MDHLRALRILGLPAGSSAEDIRMAWLDLARVWHPDRFPNDERLRKKADNKLGEVNEAYDALKDYDPEKRPGVASRMRHSVAIIFTPLPRGPIGARNSIRVLGLRPAAETPARARWVLVAGLVLAVLMLFWLGRR